MWQVLAHNYYKKIVFGHHSDPDGVFADSLGFKAKGKAKVIVYPVGSNTPFLFEGKSRCSLQSHSSNGITLLQGVTNINS